MIFWNFPKNCTSLKIAGFDFLIKVKHLFMILIFIKLTVQMLNDWMWVFNKMIFLELIGVMYIKSFAIAYKNL